MQFFNDLAALGWEVPSTTPTVKPTWLSFTILWHQQP
jgi:hypothetical protein